MSGNMMTCSSCGADNEPGRDTCVKCGKPLTGSADEALRGNLDAQNAGGLIDPRADATTMGTIGGVGDTSGVSSVAGQPLIPPRPAG